MMAFMVIANAEDMAKAATLIFYMSAVAIVSLFIGVFYLDSVAIYWLRFGRLGTETLNPISVGHLSATLAVLAIYRVFSISIASIGSRIISILFCTLGIVTLVLSASKGPMVAFVGTLLMYVLTVGYRMRAGVRVFLITVPLFVVFFLFVLNVAIELNLPIVSRFNDISTGHDPAIVDRVNMLSAAWDIFLHNPVIGGAVEIVEYRSYPHNVLLESFMATGVLGGIAFLVLVIAGTLSALRVISKNDSYSWVGLLYLQYMIGSMISGALYKSATLWAMMGAVFSISYFIRLDQKITKTNIVAR